MKKLIGSDAGYYAFNPGTQTITVYDAPPFTQEQLLIITNVTENIMLYNFAVQGLGATVSGNVITLAYLTSAMSASDALQIFIDFPASLGLSRETPASPDDAFVDPQDQIPVSMVPFYAGQRLRATAMPVVQVDEQFLDLPLDPVSLYAPPVNTVLLMQDCLQYRSVYLQVTGGAGLNAGGTLIFEGANSKSSDATNWTPLLAQQMAGVNAPNATCYVISSLASTSVFLQIPLSFRYFRVRVSTAFTGGFISLSPLFRIPPLTPNIVSANIAQWGTTAVTAAALPGVNLSQIGGTAAGAGFVQVGAGTAGGASMNRLVAAGTTNLTSVKGSAGKLFGYSITNTTATAFYVKFYNTVSGSVTVGTTAVVLTLYVPASATITGQFNADMGLAFSAAISLSTTASAVDSDTTVIGAGPILQIFYA